MTDESAPVQARPVVAYSVGYGPALTSNGVVETAIGVRFVTTDLVTSEFAFMPGDAEGLLLALRETLDQANPPGRRWRKAKPPRPHS